MPKLPPVDRCSFCIPLRYGVIFIGVVELIVGLCGGLLCFIAMAQGAEEDENVKEMTAIFERLAAYLGKSGNVIILCISIYLLVGGLLLLIASYLRHLLLLKISWMLRVVLSGFCLVNIVYQLVWYFSKEAGATPLPAFAIFVIVTYYAYVIYSHQYKLSARMVTASQPSDP